MSLPNYVRMEDLEERFSDPVFYRTYNIPLSVKRENDEWCQIIYLADLSIYPPAHGMVETELFKIRLPREDQLRSVAELLEEYCDKYQIPFRKPVYKTQG